MSVSVKIMSLSQSKSQSAALACHFRNKGTFQFVIFFHVCGTRSQDQSNLKTELFLFIIIPRVTHHFSDMKMSPDKLACGIAEHDTLLKLSEMLFIFVSLCVCHS